MSDRLATLLSNDHVVLKLRVATKAALLAELARRASALTGLPATTVQAALVAREALGSTGFGAGIAVPHARIAGLVRPFCICSRLERPLAYDAIDGKPVDLVVLLLTPSDSDAIHLSILAAISRRLRDGAVAAAMRRATSETGVLRAMIGGMTGRN